MTPEESQLMAEHVQYEVDEFRNAIRRLDRLKKTDADWNSAIELALLHFRNLRDFFFAKQTQPDDVLAPDYVAHWKPTPDSVFEDTRKDINKRLAHLTLARLTPWNPPLHRMNNAVESLIRDFQRLLTREQASWFPRLVLKHIMVLGEESYSTHSGRILGTLLPDL